jgi:hypothetical protein
VSHCTGVSITTLSGGRVVRVSHGAGPAPTVGAAVFLYQRVLYAFTPVSGGSILTRTALSSGSPAEPVVEFFNDAATSFRFFTSFVGAALAAPPADLTTIVGVELALEGKGGRPRVDGSIAASTIAQAVFFKNRP